jgi:DNA polymerase III delta subunit
VAGAEGSEGSRGGETIPRNWVIWASDVRLLDDASRRWCERWGGEAGVVALQAAETSAARFTGEVRSVPMWGGLQAVRLIHAEGAPAELVEAIEAYAASPSPTAAVLVEFTGDLKKATVAWKRIMGALPVLECSAGGGGALIRRRASQAGFRVAPEAAAALEEWAAGDFGRLASALDLLFLYRAAEKTVEPEDLEALLGAGGTPKVWKLQDAFLAGDAATVSGLVQTFEREGGTEPLMVVGMLAKQIRALLLLHGFRAKGRKDRDVGPKELGFAFPFQAAALARAASRWPEERARRALGALAELDVALKGGGGEEWAVLERALIGLCEAQG